MNKKFMTAAEAVERFIADGDQIAIGGFTVTRNPMALIREILRQRKKELYLVVHSQGQGMELLIGAGCVRRVELAYGGVARFAPTGIRFRKAVKEKQIEVEDYTNLHMTLRFMAGAMSMPFVATRSGLESDVVRLSGFSRESRGKGRVPRDKLKVIDHPLDPEQGKVVVLPPLNPDVTLIHAQAVGEDGTVRTAVVMSSWSPAVVSEPRLPSSANSPIAESDRTSRTRSEVRRARGGSGRAWRGGSSAQRPCATRRWASGGRPRTTTSPAWPTTARRPAAPARA